MPEFNRWHLLKGLAAILCVAGAVSLALIHFFPAPPSTISMAVGFKGGSYGFIAEQYKDILARSHVKLEPRVTAGGTVNLTLLQDQNSGVSAAFVQGAIGAEYYHPLSRGWSLFAGGEARGRAYHREPDFNIGSGEVHAGGALTR